MRGLLGRGAAVGGGAAGFKRTITIDHTKIPSDLVNFPMLIAETSAYLATVANGGKVLGSNAEDLGYFSDSAITTRLPHQNKRYISTTGEIYRRVLIPAVSSSVDTVVYENYANPAITTDQSNKHGVWDANYLASYPLSDGSTLDLNDATANAMNLTNSGATAALGPTGGGMAVSGGTYVITPSFATLGGGTLSLNTFTLSVWLKPTSQSAFNEIITSRVGGDPTGIIFSSFGDGRIAYDWNSDSSACWGFDSGAAKALNGVWTKVVLRIAPSGATISADATTVANAIAHSTQFLGAYQMGTNISRHYNGLMDEPLFSKITRSLDWETAMRNNEASPSTFYAKGAEVAV